MARTSKSGVSKVFQLKITLRGVKPPIWRRIQVPAQTKLPDLHLMIQAVMGWYNGHLHGFHIAGVDYAMPDPDFDSSCGEDESRVRMDQVVGAGMRFRYIYDFGDGWEHDMVVEKLLAPEPGVSYPVCVAGKRRCPPEDVGGIWGYADFLEAIGDPAHEEHGRFLEWVGGEFDPEEFDLAAVNGVLADYRSLDMSA